MRKRVAIGVGIALMATAVAHAATNHPVAASGVAVRVAGDWARVAPAPAASSSSVRTVLVVGTRGVAPRASECHVAAYRIPPDGAAVVVLTSRGAAPAGLPRDRSQLRAMKLTRPLFACFDGRGAMGQIVIGNRAYQVNVMVGDRAAPRRVADALAAARSFAAAG